MKQVFKKGEQHLTLFNQTPFSITLLHGAKCYSVLLIIHILVVQLLLSYGSGARYQPASVLNTSHINYNNYKVVLKTKV